VFLKRRKSSKVHSIGPCCKPEGFELRVNVFAKLAARVPDDVLAHDDPVEVVEGKAVANKVKKS
jgi:hypothetical protein